MSKREYTPTIVIVRATEDGEKTVASLSLRERLFRQLVAVGIEDIYLLNENEGSAPKQTVKANEHTGQVHPLSTINDLCEQFSKDNPYICIEDSFLLKDSLIETILKGDVSTVFKDNFDQIVAETITLGDKETESKVVQTGEHCLSAAKHTVQQLEKTAFSWLGKSGDGFISQYVNRPISSRISRHLVHLGLSPMVYTFLTGMLAILMSVILFSGAEYSILVGCLMYQLVSMFDGIDGELSRITYRKSAFGAVMDTAIDMVTNLMFMVGLQYALWVMYGDLYLSLGIYIVGLACSGILMMALLDYLGPRGGSFDVLAKVFRARLKPYPFWENVFNNINYAFKRDFFAFVFAVVGLLGLETAIPWSLIFGLVVWNLAILYNARAILRLKDMASETN